MRLLILDSLYFGYKLDHRTPVGEEVNRNDMAGVYENCLIVFITIEKKDHEEILERIAKDLTNIALKNKRKTIFINPFAHLSSSLASPAIALSLTKELENLLLKNKEFKIIRGAFGWYKQFDMKIKGHDTSQIYREY